MTNTVWERSMFCGHSYLRGTHDMWVRLADSEMIFTVLLKGQTPGSNDGGYRSIDAALKAKGLF